MCTAPTDGTWKKEDKHLIDLFAGFAFPALFEAGTSRSTIDFGIWDPFVDQSTSSSGTGLGSTRQMSRQ